MYQLSFQGAFMREMLLTWNLLADKTKNLLKFAHQKFTSMQNIMEAGQGWTNIHKYYNIPHDSWTPFSSFVSYSANFSPLKL